MFVSNGQKQQKFVFIHVQKTGGISIEGILKDNVPDIVHVPPRHIPAIQAKRKMEGSNEYHDWEEYFKFAFVRNPWARMVSWYSMIGSHASRRPDAAQKNPLWRYVTENSSNFEEFVKNCTDEIKLKNGSHYSFAYNQVDYLTDADGNMLLDFVGKVERFGTDLAVVCDKLDINVDEIPHKNSSHSSSAPYSSFYTPETEELIRERFKRDIEYFGYEFEDMKSYM